VKMLALQTWHAGNWKNYGPRDGRQHRRRARAREQAAWRRAERV
jgi:hypothetical protein